jgi:hypothetical protein
MSRRSWLTLALALAAAVAAAAYAPWVSLARAGSSLSCAVTGNDELAFALCERSAQMHTVCDTVPADVREHCQRCFTFGHPLACEQGTAADRARCRAVEQAVAACVSAERDTADTCQSLAWRAAQTPARDALNRLFNR